MCRPYLSNESLYRVDVAAHQDLMMNPFILDHHKSMPQSLGEVQEVKQFQLQISITVDMVNAKPPMEKALSLPWVPQPEPEELELDVVVILPPYVQGHDPEDDTTIFPSPEDGIPFHDSENDLEKDLEKDPETEAPDIDIDERDDDDATLKNENDDDVEIQREHVLDRGPAAMNFSVPLNRHGYSCDEPYTHLAFGLNHDPGQACGGGGPPSDTSDYSNSSSSSSLDHLLGISFLSTDDQRDANQKKYGHVPHKNNNAYSDDLDQNDLNILDGLLNEESQLLQYPTVPEFNPTGVMDTSLAHEEVLRFQARPMLGATENVMSDAGSRPPDTSLASDWGFFFDLFRMSGHPSISPQLRDEIELLRRRSVPQQPHMHLYHDHRPRAMSHQPCAPPFDPSIYNTATNPMLDSMNPKYNYPNNNTPSPLNNNTVSPGSSSSTCSSPAPSCASSSPPPPTGGFYDILHPVSDEAPPALDAAHQTPTTTGVLPTTGIKKNRRLCRHPGCVKRSRSQGLCITHGGGKRCRIAGCNKSSQGGDLCIRHGGGKRCEVLDCTKAAQTNGKCKSHGGGPRCKIDGCNLSSQGNGLCRSHGGGRRCAYMGCTKGTQRGEYCAIHGGSKLCSIDGCHRNDRGGGFCANHGGGRRCAIAGCKKPSRRQGRCSEHLRLSTTCSVVDLLQNNNDTHE